MPLRISAHDRHAVRPSRQSAMSPPLQPCAADATPNLVGPGSLLTAWADLRRWDRRACGRGSRTHRSHDVDRVLDPGDRGRRRHAQNPLSGLGGRRTSCGPHEAKNGCTCSAAAPPHPGPAQPVLPAADGRVRHPSAHCFGGTGRTQVEFLSLFGRADSRLGPSVDGDVRAIHAAASSISRATCLARWMREATVPTGTPRRAPASA